MAKRRRGLLGLGALLVSQKIPAEGFLIPSLSRVQFRSSERLEGLHWRHHDNRRNNHVPDSTCPLLFAKGRKDNDGGQESHGDLSSEKDSMVDMSLSHLLEELDKRGIRYLPTATRSELEILLQQSNTPQHGQTTTVSSPPLSLQELIIALDKRGIRYPPTASRVQLEAFLQRSNEQDAQSSCETVVEPVSVQQRPILDYSVSNSAHSMPLISLLAELDRLDIRYAPTASRSELEELLSQNCGCEEALHQHRRQRRRETRSEPQRPNLSNVPTDAVVTVETVSSERADGNCTTVSTTSDGDAPSSPRSDSRMPLSTLLAELDRLDIRYSPTSSRTELEELLKQSLAQQKIHEERRKRRRLEREAQDESSNGSIKDLLRESTRVATKSVQKLPRKVTRIATSPQVTSRISGVAESAARQAKRVSRRASDFWNTDEDGIRDVQFEYVSVDRPIDVPAVRMNDDEPRRGPSSTPRAASAATQRPARSDSPRPSRTRSSGPPPRTKGPRAAASRSTSSWYSDEAVPRQRRSRPSYPTDPPLTDWQSYTRQPKQRQRRPVSRQRVERSLGSSSFLLPPASKNAIPFPNNATSTSLPQDADNAARAAATKDQRPRQRYGSRSERQEKKRVYSNYVYDEDGEIEGPFDQIGDFLTNSVDRFLWGPDEDRDESTPHTRQQRTQGQTDEAQRQGSSGGRPRRTGRYWKDRLSEQVDYALGIHEDGEYYNSWETQLNEEQWRRDREGPRAWEQVSHPRSQRRRQPAKGRVKYRDPLWQQDGSMFSPLLGRTKRGGQLEVERFMDRTRGDNRMVTTFIASTIQSVLLVSTYVCRWASVRGTIPQPIVVIGTVASFLSARPRYRIRTVVVALLALRTVGELLHGYAYGDEDWDLDEGDNGTERPDQRPVEDN